MTEDNKACPKCRAVGHDTNGDHLFLMRDGKRWCCNKTMYHKETYYEDLDGIPSGPPDPVVLQQDSSNNNNSSISSSNRVMVESPETLKSGSIRGIPMDVCERYGFKIQHNGSSGAEEVYYWPVTKDKVGVTWKFKDLRVPKGDKGHFGRLKNGIKEVDFFGMNSYPLTPEYIILTEGEFDSASADAMLRKSFKRILCLSLSDGANWNDVARLKDVLLKARHIILCPDQDKVGQEFVSNVCSILPTVKIMEFSEKDANDMLREGKQVEFLDAFVNAQPYKPNCIVTSSDVKAEAIAPVTWGLDYPYPSLTALTFGIRARRIIGIGGAPGCGKTAMIRKIQEHMVFHHKLKLGLFGMEETPAEQQREMAGSIMNLPLHLPTCQYNEADLKKVIDTFDDKVYFYDKSWYNNKVNDILDNMLYMISLGVKFFFIDPISALVATMSPGDGNEFLNKFMYKLSLFVGKHDITVYYTSHLNNPQTGPDHAAGGKVYAGQFTGSKAMWRYSTDMWSGERDQYHDDPIKRNTLRIGTLKNRKPSKSGSLYLHYSETTGTLEEQQPVTGGVF